ncbi:hypothetical protein N7495_001703 [Penicillium taxi]|uniref:uncharacterized protein n=1 Tax=Penicillium taxi TaxID=168475 RepID=UPI002544E904|nr:uncharacterized protein N7495_001703 [Penicillium taxi]KAJ5909021.1 hypothetical protein N7495_001703 [Penicillium taxi]
MFGNRPNAKKPDEGLIQKFQETFSDVVRPITRFDPPTSPAKNALHPSFASVVQATPGLRFTPFLDDYSLDMPNTARALHDLDSCGFNTVFHGPAGDLHTPNLGSSLITPKTLLEQFAVTPLHINKTPLSSSLDPRYMNARQPQGIIWNDQVNAYPSSLCTHSQFAEGIVEGSSEQLPQDDFVNPEQLLAELVSPKESHPGIEQLPHTSTEFRYQVTLNTPTAMIQDLKDVPVTYLNKGQTYAITITDLKPHPLTQGIIKYRTSIRVSFEEREHVSKPSAYWALWKQNRGHEAHREFGNLYAVEFVDPKEDEDQLYSIELEKVDLDGFVVTWYADASTGRFDCTMGVRFHFLSTDFSHSKGVKGSPLRLCAKTETEAPDTAELSFCKVKLFRDHGAERRMFNDVSQLKRAIEKRKADFDKAESGSDSLGKRKRGSISAVDESERDITGKWKAQLQISRDAELAKMKSIFYSNHPVSHFGLPGEAKDDPDLFPIHMVDEVQPPIKIDQRTLPTPSLTSKSTSVSSNRSAGLMERQQIGSSDSSVGSGHSGSPSEHATTAQSSPVPVPGMSSENAEKSDAPGVNHLQIPSSKCIYIRFRQDDIRLDDYHTAVYLLELTVHEMIVKIAQKRHFDRDHGVNLFWVKSDGMKILVDDDVVQRIPDGQNMTAEVLEPGATNSGLEPAAVEVKLYF